MAVMVFYSPVPAVKMDDLDDAESLFEVIRLSSELVIAIFRCKLVNHCHPDLRLTQQPANPAAWIAIRRVLLATSGPSFPRLTTGHNHNLVLYNWRLDTGEHYRQNISRTRKDSECRFKLAPYTGWSEWEGFSNAQRYSPNQPRVRSFQWKTYSPVKLAFHDMLKAYNTCKAAADHNALKALRPPWRIRSHF